MFANLQRNYTLTHGEGGDTFKKPLLHLGRYLLPTMLKGCNISNSETKDTDYGYSCSVHTVYLCDCPVCVLRGRERKEKRDRMKV